MTEQNQDRLNQALRGLRDDAAGTAAPEGLEVALLEAFRQHHATPVQQTNRKLWAAMAIAASLTAAVVWRVSNPPTLKLATPTIMAVTAPTAQSPRVTVQPAVMKSRRPKRKAAPVKQYAAAPTPDPRSASPEDPFIAIPYAPAFTPYEDAQVVRVNMAGASVRRLGLPATADRVEADLVVGNDGLARAIRLVSNSGPNSYR
jgi:hypothetical protein